MFKAKQALKSEKHLQLEGEFLMLLSGVKYVDRPLPYSQM